MIIFLRKVGWNFGDGLNVIDASSDGGGSGGHAGGVAAAAQELVLMPVLGSELRRRECEKTLLKEIEKCKLMLRIWGDVDLALKVEDELARTRGWPGGASIGSIGMVVEARSARNYPMEVPPSPSPFSSQSPSPSPQSPSSLRKKGRSDDSFASDWAQSLSGNHCSPFSSLNTQPPPLSSSSARCRPNTRWQLERWRQPAATSSSSPVSRSFNKVLASTFGTVQTNKTITSHRPGLAGTLHSGASTMPSKFSLVPLSHVSPSPQLVSQTMQPHLCGIRNHRPATSPPKASRGYSSPRRRRATKNQFVTSLWSPRRRPLSAVGYWSICQVFAASYLSQLLFS